MDPTFIHVAEATGGGVIDLRGLSKAERQRKLAEMLSGKLRERLVGIETLDKVAGGLEELRFVADSTMARLSADVRGPSSMQARLLDPKGQEIQPAFHSAGRVEFAITQPPSGSYALQISGSSGAKIRADVQATSSLSGQLDVLAPHTGHGGITGWFTIAGRPLIGERYLLEVGLKREQASLTEANDVRIGLARRDGKVRWLDTRSERVAESRTVWVAEAQLADGEAALVRGKLGNGESFQRQLPALVPSHFSLIPDKPTLHVSSFDSVYVPTRWTPIQLTVKRRGSSGQVTVAPLEKPSKGGSLELRVEPAAFALGDGESRKLTVFVRAKVAAPAGNFPERVSALLEVGEGPRDPRANFLSIQGGVDNDSDNDGVADSEERHCGRDFDGDQDGIADVLQPEVMSIPVGLCAYSFRFTPAATFSGRESLVILGKDVPNNEWAAAGGWRIGVPADTPAVPKRLQLFVGKHPMADNRFRHLIVFDPSVGQWRIRADFDEKSRSFTLELTAQEQQQLRAGSLSLAPTVGY